MIQIDDTTVSKIEEMIKVIAEVRKFDSANDELSVEELSNVTGGVTMPDYQQFLQYVRKRDAKL